MRSNSWTICNSIPVHPQSTLSSTSSSIESGIIVLLSINHFKVVLRFDISEFIAIISLRLNKGTAYLLINRTVSWFLSVELLLSLWPLKDRIIHLLRQVILWSDSQLCFRVTSLVEFSHEASLEYVRFRNPSHVSLPCIEFLGFLLENIAVVTFHITWLEDFDVVNNFIVLFLQELSWT